MVKSRAVALSADEVAQVVQNGEHDGRRDLSSLLSKSSDQGLFFLFLFIGRGRYLNAHFLIA